MVLAVVLAVALTGYVLYESSSDSLVVVLSPDNETITTENYTGIPVTPTEYPGEVPYEESAGNTLSITLTDPVRDTSSNTSIFRVDVRVVYPGQTSADAQVYSINLTLAGNVKKTVHEITDVTFMIPEVFWGWKEVSDPASVGQTVKQTLLPGDILSNKLGEKTYWIKPDFLPVNYDVVTDFTVSCGGVSGNTVEIRPIIDYKEYNNTKAADFVSQKSTSFAVNSPERVSKYVFGDGARLLGTVDVGGKVVFSSKTMPDGSLARVYLYDGGTVTPYTGVKLSDATRFENISLTGFSDLDLSKDHGDGASAGIFARGNDLVMGMGVETVAADLIHVPQIFGGDVDSTKRGLMGSGFVLSTLDSDTHVVVNSGIYANVVGGSRGGEINGSTTVVVNGGVVLDTLVGGSSTFREPMLDLPIIGSLYDPVVNPGKISGGTHVYINGGLFPGDYYEYSKYGDQGHRFIDLLKVLTESCIITGGSNDGRIGLDTEVIISGDADVWDVQGGGRRGGSTLEGTSNVTICGNAVVRHTASGSITEGIDSRSDSLSAVHHTNVTVCENARVYSVFGAGYDTFTQSLVPSVRSPDSTITVNISGGTVGYVYGGGYRGTVGSGEDSMIESVEINITGGTVLNDVYGGGRGGLDRIFHDAGGNLVPNGHGTGYSDPTGSSLVYARNITINITGGTVCGNVYGGGQSIPFKNIENSAMTSEVAAVYCENIIIDIHGGSAEVQGSVFGVGNGIDPDTIGGIPQIRFYKDDGQPDFAIPWKNGLTAYDASEATLSYDRYAYVKAGTVSVNITGYQDRASAGSPEIGIYGGGNNASAEAGKVEISVNDSVLYGPVMGGGMFGTLTAGDAANPSPSKGVFINIGGSTVNGTVFGGGFGSGAAGAGGKGYLEVNGTLGITVTGGRLSPSAGAPALVGGGNYGNVAAGSVAISLNGANVSGNVMGGGILGTVTADSSSMDVVSSTVNGTVFGGGLGVDSVADSGKGVVTIRSNAVITVSDSTVSPDSLYAVVGGGSFASMTFGNLSIKLNGSGSGNCTVNGDVHAGGIGYTYTATGPGGVQDTKYSASAFGNREIVLSGATVNGNVYGGSRLGSDFDGTPDSPIKEVYIRLLSGKVTQSVFGGGFQGDSYLNSHILLGAAAVQGPSDRCGTLSVGSVYGGSNQKGSTQPEDLFKGKPVIDISGSRQTGDTVSSCDITVNGVIYGCGNFSNVGVGADIVIEGFRNDRSHPVSSIQMADTLTVKNSDFFVRGGSAGNVLATTTPMSIGMVGSVVLKGSVILHLMADTYDIEGYRSLNGNSVALQEDTLQSYRNEIRMYNGKVFSVLGDMEKGLDSSGSGTVIEGYSLLSVDSDETYFGAYAMSSDSTVNGGFTTNHGRELANILVNDGNPGTNTWYISGHSEKFNLLTIRDNAFSGSFDLLRIGGEDTFFNYDGCSVESTSKDSLVAVGTAVPDSPAIQMAMVLGTAAGGTPSDDIVFNTDTGTVDVVTHSFVNGKWVPVKSSGDGPFRSVGGSSLAVEIGVLSNKAKNVGNVGDFVISFTEISHRIVEHVDSEGLLSTTVREVPLNVVDYRFEVYIDPGQTKNVDISTTVSGIYREEDGLYHAAAHIILPSLDQRYSYGVEVPGGPSVTSMTVLADNGYNGIEGWIASRYTTTPLTVGPDGTSVPDFGVAGIKMATLTVDLAFTPEQTSRTQTMVVTANMEKSGSGGAPEPYTYNIEIAFQAMDDIRMYFLYQSYCDGSGGFSENTGKFRYISFQGKGTVESPYVLEWAPCVLQEEGGAYTVLPKEGELSTFTCQYGDVPLKQTFYFVSGTAGQASKATLESAVKQMMGKISSQECEQSTFDYGKSYIGLFDDKNAVKKHSPSSAAKEDTTLFAGFGIKVTFRAEGIPLKITNVVLKPGQSLTDKGLVNLEEEIADDAVPSRYNHICAGYDRPGYTMKKFDTGSGTPVRTWVYDNVSGQPYDFDTQCIENVSLTVPWESKMYTLRVTFGGTDSLPDTVVLKQTYPKTSYPDIVTEGNVMTSSVGYGNTYQVVLQGSGYVAQSISHAAEFDIHTEIVDPSAPVIKITKAGNQWSPDSNVIDVQIALEESGFVTVSFRGAESARMSDGPIGGETLQVNGSTVSPGDVLNFDYAELTQTAAGAEFTVTSTDKTSYYALWDGKTPLTDRVKCGNTVSVDVHAHRDIVLTLHHDVTVKVLMEQNRRNKAIPFDTDVNTDYRFTVTSVGLDGQTAEETREPSLIFNGYMINVFKKEGDKYTFPTETEGVGKVVLGTNTASYTIDGSAPSVQIKIFLSGVVDVHLTFPSDGAEILAGYSAYYPEYRLKVTVTDPGRSSEFLFVPGDLVLDETGTANLTVKASTKQQDYDVVCSIPGFAVTPDAGNAPGLTDYRFSLEVVQYSIFFPDETAILPNEEYTYGTPALAWSIRDGPSVGGAPALGDPADWPNSCITDGYPVWKTYVDGQAGLYSGVPDPCMFDSNGEARLIPFEKVREVPESPGADGIVFLTEDAFAWGPASDHVDLNFPDELYLRGIDGTYATYKEDLLTIYCEDAGTGSMVLVDDLKGFVLEVVILKDISMIDGGSSFIVITLDGSGTDSVPDIQGSNGTETQT